MKKFLINLNQIELVFFIFDLFINVVTDLVLKLGFNFYFLNPFNQISFILVLLASSLIVTVLVFYETINQSHRECVGMISMNMFYVFVNAVQTYGSLYGFIPTYFNNLDNEQMIITTHLAARCALAFIFVLLNLIQFAVDSHRVTMIKKQQQVEIKTHIKKVQSTKIQHSKYKKCNFDKKLEYDSCSITYFI